MPSDTGNAWYPMDPLQGAITVNIGKLVPFSPSAQFVTVFNAMATLATESMANGAARVDEWCPVAVLAWRV